MTDMRHARMVLGALREAAVLEGRLRRVAEAAKPRRARNPREIDMVEVAPGVWAMPKRRPTPQTALGRLHDTVARIVDAFDDAPPPRPRGRR
jgi:hypothetical protein